MKEDRELLFWRKKKKDDVPHVLEVRSKGAKVLFAAVFVLFCVYCVMLLYPFLLLFINSLKGGLEYINDLNARNIMNLPDSSIWKNYVEAFTNMAMMDSKGRNIYMPEMLFNSIYYSLGFAVSGVAASTLTAYCMSKYEFKGRSLMYGIAIFAMTIPNMGTGGAFLKLIVETGIHNTPLYCLITGFSGWGFNFIVLYGFFKNISWSYAEAAMIDGAGNFKVFLKVMLPQATPVLVTLIVMSFIGAWNDASGPLLNVPDYPTLASGLYKIQLSITRGGNYPIYFAGILLSALPIILLFTFCSDIIMKNMSVGGLKG